MDDKKKNVDFRDLVGAGVHFGHQKNRWCPKMAPYIWGHKNNIHLIDISKTAHQLEKSAKFLEGIAAQGKSILWVGTKKPAQDIINRYAAELGMPFVSHRWIGGTLSNKDQVRKSITKLLHLEDILAKAALSPHYTKKELNTYQKMAERLKKNIGGIRNMAWPLGAIVLVDVKKERSALKEASIMGVPVVGLVDTNSDPGGVDYVIPANDDSPRSIQILIEHLAQGAARGIASAKQNKSAQQEEMAAKRAADAKNKMVKKETKPEAAVKSAAAAPVAEATAKAEAPKKAVKAVKKDEEATSN